MIITYRRRGPRRDALAWWLLDVLTYRLGWLDGYILEAKER